MNNKQFSESLIEYIKKTDLEKLAGDSIILLVNIFNKDLLEQMD
jgi:hypothetical protein